MKRARRYGVKSLREDFPTDKDCLEFIFSFKHSKKCSCGGTYKLITGRKQFQCSSCRFQIAPMAGTIFNKSDTPLTLWFEAILAFSNAKSGFSAKQLERQLEVTYKTAWRMLMLFRKALADQGGDKLQGDVEVDHAYFGGRFKSGKNNQKQKEAIAAKTSVMGAVQRGGKVRVKVVPDGTAKTHWQFLRDNVEPKETRVMSDKSNRFEQISGLYDRHSVDHHKKEYVRGDIYTNTVEGLFGHLKRSIKGVHKAVSRKYLQAYLDGYVFLRNNSYSDKARFVALIGKILVPVK